MRSADDYRFASLEAGLHEHAVGKTRTFFNGAEIGFTILNDIDESLVAILDECLRRNPRQNAGFYFFCMSGLPAFQAWPTLSPVT